MAYGNKKNDSNVQAPKFPITLQEVMERAKGLLRVGPSTGGHRIYKVLTTNQDTLAWLEAMKPIAFKKGAVTGALPRATTSAEAAARRFVMNTCFAFAKEVKGTTTLKMPGGKFVEFSEEDRTSVLGHYGICADGRLNEQAVSAMAFLENLSYEVDNLSENDSQSRGEWAHGDHALSRFEADLREGGISGAETLQEAVQMADKKSETFKALKRAASAEEIVSNDSEKRKYRAGFAVFNRAYLDERGPNNLFDPVVRTKGETEEISATLRGPVAAVRGSWEALQVPRSLKPFAFTRVVDLLEAALKASKAERVVCDTDDIIGRAAASAATRLGLKIITISKAGKQAHPLGDLDARIATGMEPYGPTKDNVQGMVNEQMAKASLLITLGLDLQVQHLTESFQANGLPTSKLDTRWATHHGLKGYEYVAAEKVEAIPDMQAEEEINPVDILDAVAELDYELPEL